MSSSITSNGSGKRQARCHDPSKGAPIVWVTQGRTQHMAFLLEEKGDYKKIRWASTSLTEWVESNAVSYEMEGRSRRRGVSSSANNTATSPTSNNSSNNSSPVKRRVAQKGVDYMEKESEEEFEWDAEEEEEEEADVDFASRISGKKQSSSKDNNNSSRKKKKKKKRKRESDDTSDQEFFSADEEIVAKKPPKRAKTEQRPSYEELTEEEFSEEVVVRNQKPSATAVDNRAYKSPRKNSREYPVSAKDIKAGASIAKKTKKRGWITGRIVSVEKKTSHVKWSTGKEDQVEMERMPKLLYDADTSHYPVGTRVRKRNDDITKSGKVVSLNNSQYHILYKNQTKEVVGTSEMDQILKISARKQAAATVPTIEPILGTTMEFSPRVQTPGQSTGSEAMTGNNNRQRDSTVAYKDSSGSDGHENAAASLEASKSKRDKLDAPSILVAVGSSKSRNSPKRTDSTLKDAPKKASEQKPAPSRKAVDPPDNDLGQAETNLALDHMLDEPLDVPVAFSPTNASSKIQFIASQLQKSSSEEGHSIDLPVMQDTSRAAVDPEDSVKDNNSLQLPSPKSDAKEDVECESNSGDADVETIDLTAKIFEATSTADQQDAPETLSPAIDPPCDSPAARSHEDESSAPDANNTPPMEMAKDETAKKEDSVLPEAIVPKETGEDGKTSAPAKVATGDTEVNAKLTPEDDNNTTSVVEKGMGSSKSDEQVKEAVSSLPSQDDKMAAEPADDTAEELAGESTLGDENGKSVSSPPSQAIIASAEPQGNDNTKGTIDDTVETRLSQTEGGAKEGMGASESTEKDKESVVLLPSTNEGKPGASELDQSADKASAQTQDTSVEETNVDAAADEERDKAKAGVEPEEKFLEKTAQDGEPESKPGDEAEAAGKSKPTALPPTSEDDTEQLQQTNGSMSLEVPKSGEGQVEKSDAANEQSPPVENERSDSDKAVSTEAKRSIQSSVASEKEKRHNVKAALLRPSRKKEKLTAQVKNAQAQPGSSTNSKKRKAAHEEQPKRKRPKSDSMARRNSGSFAAKPMFVGRPPASINHIVASPHRQASRSQSIILSGSRKIAGQRKGTQRYFLPDPTRQTQTKRSIADVLLSRPPDRKKQVVAKHKETGKPTTASNLVISQPGSGKERAIAKQLEKNEPRSFPTKEPTAAQGSIPGGLKKMKSQTKHGGNSGSWSVPAAATGKRRPADFSTRMPAQGQAAPANWNARAPSGSQGFSQPHTFNPRASAPPQPQQPADYATQQRIALESLIRQQNPALYYALSHPAMANWAGHNAPHPQAANPYGPHFAPQAHVVAPTHGRPQVAPTTIPAAPMATPFLAQNRTRRAGQSDPPGTSPGNRRPGSP